jgi:drug/metabolite transporter (DMT)-like permease
MKWVLVMITVVTTVLSDVLQSYEMKRVGEQSIGARGVMRLAQMCAQRRYLILSMVFMALSFFAFMALVQRAPLSFAVPASASSFVLEMALAKLTLRERLGMRRTAGAALVVVGIFLLGRG